MYDPIGAVAPLPSRGVCDWTASVVDVVVVVSVSGRICGSAVVDQISVMSIDMSVSIIRMNM